MLQMLEQYTYTQFITMQMLAYVRSQIMIQIGQVQSKPNLPYKVPSDHHIYKGIRLQFRTRVSEFTWYTRYLIGNRKCGYWYESLETIVWEPFV